MSGPRIVFLFSGQGSQYYQMGREFYGHHRTFREWMDYGSRLLEPHLRLSLVELLYRDRPDRFAPFDQTRLTHPAIFCLNYSVAQALWADGIRPGCLLGYSLGELVTWTMAGVISFEDALACVVEMAAKIEEQTPPAGMLALLASPDLVRANPELFRDTWIACYNYAGNFVITGLPGKLAKIQETLRPSDIPCQLLPITRGFHSPLLDPVEPEIRRGFAGLSLQPATLPVVSCLRARELAPKDFDAQHAWDLLREPVRFGDTIGYLESRGPSLYVDVGPSGTLAAITRAIVGKGARSQMFPILTPYGKDLWNLEKLQEGLAGHRT